MKIEVSQFKIIIIKLTEIVKLLGYSADNLCIEEWVANDKGELVFWLIDNKTKEEFRIVLPKIKEK